MEVRETSRESYAKIIDALGPIYRAICTILHTADGPLTSLEIDEACQNILSKKIESDKRMAEMVRRDLVIECETRECAVSVSRGSPRNAITYTVTGRPPRDDAKRSTERPNVRQIREELKLAQEEEAWDERYAEGVTYALNWVLGEGAAPISGITD